MILFPLMNQIFNPEFTPQAFYLAQFATDSVRALLRYSLNRKLMKSSPFVSELILGDCDLFLTGIRVLEVHVLSHYC